MGYEITDEEYEGLRDAETPCDLNETVARITSRIESERHRKEVKIGPDYLGSLFFQGGGSYDEVWHLSDKEAILKLKQTISTFLKGRMKSLKEDVEKCTKEQWCIKESYLSKICELSYIHLALCGEVKDGEV